MRVNVCRFCKETIETTDTQELLMHIDGVCRDMKLMQDTINRREQEGVTDHRGLTIGELTVVETYEVPDDEE